MDPKLASRLRVVLVEPTHPGNIGASARAMKTMGLRRLLLVRPARFPCAEATARAAGADDILYRARVCDSLSEALQGCAWVVATSARRRRLEWPELTPPAAAARMVEEAARGDTAVVFGREHSGLSNEELGHCQAVLRIPSDRDYQSLNLAAAVQIVAYELRRAAGSAEPPAAEASALASNEELEGLYAHLEQALADVGYYDPQRPKLLMRRLRRLFSRAALETSEVNILRGVLKAAQKAARR